MNSSQSREEFERWISSKRRTDKTPDGSYVFTGVDLAWEAWQAKDSKDTERLEFAIKAGLKMQTSFAVWSVIESRSQIDSAIAQQKEKRE